MIAQVNKSIEVRQTSLPPDDVEHQFAARRHTCSPWPTASAVGPEGDLASGRTLVGDVVVPRQGGVVLSGARSRAPKHELLEKLEASVREVHEGLVGEYGGVTSKLPATTLTLVLLVWPRAYHIQVGDSRAYVSTRRPAAATHARSDARRLHGVGRCVDRRAGAEAPSAEKLSSAIGGSELVPVVGLIDLAPGDTLLLCTDGLTKHVSDEQIARALARTESAESTSAGLLARRLDGRGTDNVTVVVVRTSPRSPTGSR